MRSQVETETDYSGNDPCAELLPLLTQLAMRCEPRTLFLPSGCFIKNLSRRALMVRLKPRKCEFLIMETENIPKLNK
jgi:hypothetical protein